jgi:4,5-epoxidase
MSTDPADVLVVGAGPVGLTLATSLSLQGVSVRVVDRTSGPPERESSSLQGRGSGVLQRLGALGDLPDEVPILNRATAYLGQQPIRLRYTTPGVRNPAPPMVISQARIEQVLRDRLAGLGVAVEWDSGLAGLEEDGAGVTVVFGSGDRVRAGWVVGCDGPESMVRKSAGIGFPGRSDRFLMLDARVDWDLDRDGLTGWLHPDGRVGAMPMVDPEGANNLWRILARDPRQETEKLSDEEIVSRVQTVLAERTPYGGARLRDITTKLVFTAHSRIAETYRKGHVLLAGDAAHGHVPFGGPAIHTGMGDAENLAWKLALVIQDRAGEPLLDTYQAERRPIADEILLGATGSTSIDIMRNPVVRFTRDRVVAPLTRLPLVRRLTTFSSSRLWETYFSGPLGGGSRLGSKPRPGDTVADFECVRTADRRLTRLYDELGGRWALLVPAGGADRCVDVARQWLGADRFVVLERTVGTAAGRSSRKAQAAAGEAWLVRPDAHLAWRGRPDSPDLGRWLEGALRHGRARR